jgi:hypothetical protein
VKPQFHHATIAKLVAYPLTNEHAVEGVDVANAADHEHAFVPHLHLCPCARSLL